MFNVAFVDFRAVDWITRSFSNFRGKISLQFKNFFGNYKKLTIIIIITTITTVAIVTPDARIWITSLLIKCL